MGVTLFDNNYPSFGPGVKNRIERALGEADVYQICEFNETRSVACNVM
jgi:hypothetical protein